ncbi:MAG: tripartite tricarboxylate transporter TctB family protein, partial [Ramlibacter sp.]
YQTVLSKARNTEIFVDSVQLKRVLQVLLPALVYVGAVQFLGLYLASAVYIALFMVYLGKYTWVKSLIASVAVITLFFFMFEVWFKVPLFKGTLDPLRFLGY